MLVAWAATYVIRQCRRAGRIMYGALALAGGTLIAWLEPYMNFARPTAETYNSYYVNLGSWGPYLPSFPDTRNTREPLPLVYEACYSTYFLPLAMFGCAVMRRCARRRPSIGKPGPIGCAFVTILMVESVIDIAYVRLSFYQYWNTVPQLTLWAGKPYQYPVYAAVLASAYSTSLGALRYFRDEHGHTLGERGIDVAAMPHARAVILRFLGITRCLTLVFAAYVFSYAASSIYGGPIPDRPPTYMLNNVCGTTTHQPCSP